MKKGEKKIPIGVVTLGKKKRKVHHHVVSSREESACTVFIQVKKARAIISNHANKGKKKDLIVFWGSQTQLANKGP